MAFTLELQKPTDGTPGILGFYNNFAEASAVLDAWSKTTAPTQAQLSALLDCICFFVPKEQRVEARRQLLEEASIADVTRIVLALSQMLTPQT